LRFGSFAAAKALYEESLAMRQEIGDTHGFATTLQNLANILACNQDYSAARSLYEQSLRMKHDLGDRTGIADSLERFCSLALFEGECPRAARLAGAAAAIRHAIGSPTLPVDSEALAGDEARARLALGDTAFDTLWREGHEMTQDRAVALALSKETVN